MYVTLALVCALIVSVWSWFKRKFSYWRRNGIKEWSATSIFGNFSDYIALKGNEVDVADTCYLKLGDVKFGGYYFLWKPIVLVKDPEMIKMISVKNFESFADHQIFLDVKRGTDNVARSLFFLKFDEWKPKRSAMAHFFTPKKLKNIHTAAEKILCENLLPKFDISSKTMEDVEIEKSIAEVTINIITTTFIGVNLNDQTVFKEAANLFALPGLATIIKTILYILHPKIHTTFRLTTLNKRMHEIFEELVEKVITQREMENIELDDLFGYLIRSKNGLVKHFEGITQGEIIGHIFSFFIAGHDTTSLTAGFVFYELSKNQEIQDKLRSEIHKSIQEHGEGLSYDAIKNIPYLNCVIQEATRMYPILGVIKRVCTKPYKFDNFDVPVGMEIVIPIRALHRDPKYFEDPDTFNPDRFATGKAPDVFMPFGKGPRTCIGRRFAEVVLKVAISQLIINYEFLPSSKNKLPFQFEPSVVVTTRPVGGLWVKMRKISNKVNS